MRSSIHPSNVVRAVSWRGERNTISDRQMANRPRSHTLTFPGPSLRLRALETSYNREARSLPWIRADLSAENSDYGLLWKGPSWLPVYRCSHRSLVLLWRSHASAKSCDNCGGMNPTTACSGKGLRGSQFTWCSHRSPVLLWRSQASAKSCVIRGPAWA